MSVVRGPTPTQTFAKLRLCGIVNITLDGADFNEWDTLSSMLNLGAPSAFFSGQQPIGFDQWSALFQRYTVHYTKVKVEASRQVISGDDRLLSVTLLPSTMTITQIRAAADGGGATGQGVACPLQCDRYARTVHIGTNSANAQLVTISNQIKTKTLFQTDNIKDDPDFTGTTSTYTSGVSAPVNNANWYIGIQANDVPGASTIIQCRVYITFYTQFSSPVNIYDT